LHCMHMRCDTTAATPSEFAMTASANRYASRAAWTTPQARSRPASYFSIEGTERDEMTHRMGLCATARAPIDTTLAWSSAERIAVGLSVFRWCASFGSDRRVLGESRSTTRTDWASSLR